MKSEVNQIKLTQNSNMNILAIKRLWQYKLSFSQKRIIIKIKHFLYLQWLRLECGYWMVLAGVRGIHSYYLNKKIQALNKEILDFHEVKKAGTKFNLK